MITRGRRTCRGAGDTRAKRCTSNAICRSSPGGRFLSPYDGDIWRWWETSSPAPRHQEGGRAMIIPRCSAASHRRGRTAWGCRSLAQRRRCGGLGRGWSGPGPHGRPVRRRAGGLRAVWIDAGTVRLLPDLGSQASATAWPDGVPETGCSSSLRRHARRIATLPAGADLARAPVCGPHVSRDGAVPPRSSRRGVAPRAAPRSPRRAVDAAPPSEPSRARPPEGATRPGRAPGRERSTDRVGGPVKCCRDASSSATSASTSCQTPATHLGNARRAARGRRARRGSGGDAVAPATAESHGKTRGTGHRKGRRSGVRWMVLAGRPRSPGRRRQRSAQSSRSPGPGSRPRAAARACPRAVRGGRGGGVQRPPRSR